MAIVYVDNDNILEVDALQNAVTLAYINSATVTVTLVDGTGAEVTGDGVSWPLTLDYVGASDGTYRATLSDSLVLVDESSYTAQITADGGSGLVASWELPVLARIRTS